MKIYFSYYTADRSEIDSVADLLRAHGYVVMVSVDDMPPGGDYAERVRKAINEADLFVFYMRKDSLAPGRYTLSELAFAQARKPTPRGWLLPVMLEEIPKEGIPTWVQSVNILKPRRDLAGDVLVAVDYLASERSVLSRIWSSLHFGRSSFGYAKMKTMRINREISTSQPKLGKDEKRVVISYRRADSAALVGRLHDRLTAAYGRGNVFLDIDNIPFGKDFRTHIRDTIAGSDVVLAVIGPSWLGVAQSGDRRIDEPADVVRLELELANECGKTIVPILVGQTEMPHQRDLPESIRSLVFHNAIRIDPGVDFHLHVDRLISGLANQ